MPKSRIILAIGLFIALLPVLGFPHAWESFFEIVGGLGIVCLSVLIAIDKRLSLKVKAERRLATRRAKTRPDMPMEEPSLNTTNEEAPLQ
ncbi:hypothetical protein KW800_03050 [Candidatus Parcubacteria bacterium]|nr:hypothetical protein [Candidatus Parcubacteria bacterium]